jgi:hypothetical protein
MVLLEVLVVVVPIMEPVEPELQAKALLVGRVALIMQATPMVVVVVELVELV